MNKKCFKCGRRKPIDQFYAHPMMADGRLGKCKTCTRRDVRERYVMTRAARSEYERNRFRRPERKQAMAGYAKAMRRRNPGKARARQVLCNAVRDGRVVKPSACTKCGRAGRLEGHHHDYRKPLDVQWLCFACHRSVHGQVCTVDRI